MAEDNPIEGLDPNQSAFEPMLDMMDQDTPEDLSRTTTTTTLYISGDQTQIDQPKKTVKQDDPIKSAVDNFRLYQKQQGMSANIGDVNKLFPNTTAEQRIQLVDSYPELFKEDRFYNQSAEKKYQEGLDSGKSSLEILDSLVEENFGSRVGLMKRFPNLFSETEIQADQQKKVDDDNMVSQDKEVQKKIKDLNSEYNKATDFNQKRRIQEQIKKLENDQEYLQKLAKDTDYQTETPRGDIGKLSSISTEDFIPAEFPTDKFVDTEKLEQEQRDLRAIEFDIDYVVPIIQDQQELDVFEGVNTALQSGLDNEEYLAIYKEGKYNPEKHEQYDKALAKMFTGIITKDPIAKVHASFYERNGIDKNQLQLRNDLIIQNIPDLDVNKIYTQEEQNELVRIATSNFMKKYGDIEFDELKIILGPEITPMDMYNETLKNSKNTVSPLNIAIVKNDEDQTLENLQELFPENTSMFRFSKTNFDGQDAITIRTYVAGEMLKSVQINLDESNEPLRKIRKWMSEANPPAYIQDKLMTLYTNPEESEFWNKKTGKLDEIKLALFATMHPGVFGSMYDYSAGGGEIAKSIMVNPVEIRSLMEYANQARKNQTLFMFDQTRTDKKLVPEETIQLLESRLNNFERAIAEEKKQKGTGVFASMTEGTFQAISGFDEVIADTYINLSAALGYTDLSDEEEQELLSRGITRDQIVDIEQKRRKKQFKAELDNLKGRFSKTDQIAINESGFLTKALNTTVNSLVTMAAGGGTKRGVQAAFALTTGGRLMNELEDSDLSTLEKLSLVTPMALIEGVLEEFGMQSAIRQGLTPLKKQILLRALKDLPKNASFGALNQSIKRVINEMAGGTINKVSKAMAIEALTEAGQSGAEIVEKNLINEISGYELFEGTPDITTVEGVIEASEIVVESAELGAFSGNVINVSSQGLSKASEFLSNKSLDFNSVYSTLTDNQSRDLMIDRIDLKVLKGELSEQDATTIKENFNKAYPIMMEIPTELSSNQKEQSYDLLLERKALEAEVKDKDKNLVVKQTDRIAEINDQLQQISKTDAVQEQETKKEVLPDEQSKMGLQDVGQREQAVGKDSIKKQKLTEVSAENKQSVLPQENNLGGNRTKTLQTEYEFGDKGSVGVYTDKETGSQDVFLVIPDKKSDKNYIGFKRVYKDGKPTNEFSIKADMSTAEKGSARPSFEAINEVLPEGFVLIETTNISSDGMTMWSNQIKNGYKPTGETFTVDVNTDGKKIDLEGTKSKGDFSKANFTEQELAEAEVKINDLIKDLPGAKIESRKITPPMVKDALYSIKVTLPKLQSPSKSETKPTEVQQEQLVESVDDQGRSAKPGARLFNDPNPETSDISAKYKKEKGIETTAGEKITELDTSKSMEIADAYEAMENNPNDPEVKEAYESLAKETIDQYKAMTDAGYEIEIYEGKGEPYANSQEMIDDLINNKHMYIFSTEQGYGEAGITDQQRQENAMLAETEFVDKNGKPLLINDLFRGVHDFFGHSERGNGFGAKGEENAWDVHARMFTDKARRAMTAETRGQNSWVNFGPQMRDSNGNLLKKGDPGYKSARERDFAPQKIGLLPEQYSEITETPSTEVTEEVVEKTPVKEAPKKEAKGIRKQIENARKAIAKILPGVEIVVHENEDSYRKATNETDSKKQASRGEYNTKTKKIHINISKANNRTVAHEVFHAILLSKVKTDQAAKDLTERMIKALSKNLEGMPEVKQALDAFAANDDENIQSEEKLAELVGILAGNYAQMNKPSQSLIKRFLDRLAKMFGLKTFTDGEVVDLLNTIAGKVAVGAEISDVDLKVIPSPTDSKGNLKTPSKKSQNNLKKRKQNIIDGVKDQVVSGEIVSTSLPNKDDVHSSKEYVVGISSLEEMASTDNRAKDQYIKIAKEAASYGISKTKDVNNFEDAKKVISEFKEVVKSNLKWLHDSVDKDVRDISKLWYDGANKISNDLANEYGYTTEQVSGVMAVLSPQMDWFRNLSLGERVINIYKNNQDSLFDEKMIKFVNTKTTGTGKKKKPLFKNKEEIISRVKNKKLSELNPKDQSYFIRVYDEVYNSRDYNNITPNGEINGLVRTKSGNPGKVGWGDFSTIEKAISILNDGSVKNISTNLGNQHKVRNFFNNISNPNDKNAVTIDTHAVAAALLKPLSGKSKQVAYNFGGSSAVSTGMTGTYPVYADAYRELANELGILPREVQSITWEAGRGLFKAAFKSNKSNEQKIDNVWKQYESGSISLKEAQSKIDKLAGGISTPVWYEYLANENVESLDKNSAALDQAALDEEVSIDDQVTTPAKRKQKDDGTVEPRKPIRNLKKKSDKKIKETNKGKGPILRRLRRSLFDRQNDIKRVIKDFVPNPKKVSKIINRIVTKAGASGYANEIFKQNDKKIFGGLKADQIENLELIIYARRIVAINENRRENGKNPYTGMDGFNEQDAIENLEKFEQDLGKKEFDALSERADLYFKAMKNNLKMLRDSGRITEETYKNLEDVEYSPIMTLKYMIPKDTITDEDINNAVSTLGVNKKDIMKLSDQNENEILFDARFLLMMNTNIYVRRSFENEMLNEFAQGYKSIDKAGKEALSDFIIDEPVKKVPPGFRKVEYFQDGVEKEMVMKEEYARQLLDMKNQNNMLKGVGKVTGANILRFFATGGNPLFIVGNTAVDFANIAFFSDVYSAIKPLATVQLAYDFVKNFLRKTGSTNNYNKIKMEFMEHGGAMDFLSTDGLRMVHDMRLKNRILNKAQKGLAAYARFMSYVGETGEMSFRLAVYERVKKAEIKKFEKENDRSPNQQEMEDIMFEAAAQSRETIDFSQGGTWVKQMDQALPYFNAAMQGLRRPLDFVRKNPVGFTSNVVQYAVMAAGMTATSLGTLLRAIGDDEEEKKKVQDTLDSVSMYEKANYHIIFTGNKDKDGNYQYIRIKKLPLLSILGTATEQYTTKYLLKSKGINYEIDDRSIKKSIEMSAPLDVLGPVMGDESVIQAVGSTAKRNPLVSAWLTYSYNEDTFTGDKVFYEPKDKKIKPYAEGLYDDRVNDIYKVVAPALNMSPKRSQAAVEKIVTSESTNPSISIFYALTNGLFDTEADAFKENSDTFDNGMEHFLDVVSKKMVRHTNPNLLRYKNQDRLEELEKSIDTDAYLTDKKIKKEIDKSINFKNFRGQGDEYYKEQEKMDELFKKYDIDTLDRNSYVSYAELRDLKGNQLFKEMSSILYEKNPKMMAARLYEMYGNDFDIEAEETLLNTFKVSKRNSKVLLRGEKFYNKYYLNKSQEEIDKFEKTFGKIR